MLIKESIYFFSSLRPKTPFLEIHRPDLGFLISDDLHGFFLDDLREVFLDLFFDEDLRDRGFLDDLRDLFLDETRRFRADDLRERGFFLDDFGLRDRGRFLEVLRERGLADFPSNLRPIAPDFFTHLPDSGFRS